MVEKIDRPEAKPIYEIREPKGTHEDQHQSPNQREEAERQYKKQLEGDQKEWSKFGQRSMVIKPFKVPTDRVNRIVLRGINLHKGVGIIQTDITWKDGRDTKGALMRLARMEDYFRLRKLSAGDEVPRDLWEKTTHLEFGILQSIGASGPFTSPGIMEPHDEGTKRTAKPFDLLKSIGIKDRRTGRISWGIVAFYIAALTGITIALFVGFS